MNVNTTQKEIKVSKTDFLVSKTDLKGVITYCNREFMKIADYEEKALLGKPHNLVRHEDMPKAVFALLWENIQKKEEVFAFVKNKTSKGNFYWVYANVTASVDEHGNIIGYHSVRRKPNENALKAIQEIYKILLDEEKANGLKASLECLQNMLKERNVGYNEFILSLQHDTRK